MPIIRKTTYICDGCGKEIRHWRDKHETLRIDAHNYNGDWSFTRLYCDACVKFMWSAINTIPRLRDEFGE